MRQCLT